MRASHCGGFSCGPQALGVWALVARGIWNLPGPGIEPVSPALADSYPLFHQGSPALLFLNKSKKKHNQTHTYLAALGLSFSMCDLVA